MKAISWRDFRSQASARPARIVLADGEDSRVVEAAALAKEQHIAEPLLLGSKKQIEQLWKKHSRHADVPCVDPEALTTEERSRLVEKLRALGKFKALTTAEAEARLKDTLVLGCLYVHEGMADGFIGGATRTTGDTLKAVFSIVGLAETTHTLFGFFLIESFLPGRENPLVLLADCAVTPEPSAKQLSNIAIGASNAFECFTGDKAKVAFLSFSTRGSAVHAMVDKIRLAVQMTREKAPALVAEGEWQADAALDSFSAEIKGIGISPMAGQANVLIAPDLNCGNIAYKLVQRLGRRRAVGPVLWGTAHPANDLSRGCSTEDVLDMLALTSLQAQKSDVWGKLSHAR